MRVALLVDQRHLAHLVVERDRLDVGHGEADILQEGRQEGIFARGQGRADLLALEVGRRLDRRFRPHRDAHRGVVVEAAERQQRQALDRLLDRIGRGGDAELVLALGDRLGRRGRAGALLDDDVDAGLGPELLGGVGPDVGALGQPAQRVFHRDLLLREDLLRREAGPGGERPRRRGDESTAGQPIPAVTPCCDVLAHAPPLRATSPRPSRNMHAKIGVRTALCARLAQRHGALPCDTAATDPDQCYAGSRLYDPAAARYVTIEQLRRWQQRVFRSA